MKNTILAGLTALALGACASPNYTFRDRQYDERDCVEWKKQYDEGGNFSYRKCVAWNDDDKCKRRSSDEFLKDVQVQEMPNGSFRIGSVTILDQSSTEECD